MSTEFELKFDENTILVGDIDYTPDHIDYECHGRVGTHHLREYHLTNFSIIVYIGGMDFDVTPYIKETNLESYNYFKNYLLDKYIERQ